MPIFSKEDLMQDPSTLFNEPSDVLDAPELSAQQKIVVLKIIRFLMMSILKPVYLIQE